MKLVIQTQYRENYGAHDWDGEGECPQRWKNKWGSTYVVRNLTEKMQRKIELDGIPTLKSLIDYEDHGSSEEVVSFQVVADDAFECEEWETAWTLEYVFTENEVYEWVASKYTKREDYWEKGVLGKNESYIMGAGARRKDYVCEYIKDDEKDLN